MSMFLMGSLVSADKCVGSQDAPNRIRAAEQKRINATVIRRTSRHSSIFLLFVFYLSRIIILWRA